MMDIRNAYGFPIVARVERARQYAAEAKERNKPPCDCQTCRYMELLPAVIKITTNWRNQ